MRVVQCEVDVCRPFAFRLAVRTPLPVADVVNVFRFRFPVAALDLHHCNSKGRSVKTAHKKGEINYEKMDSLFPVWTVPHK